MYRQRNNGQARFFSDFCLTVGSAAILTSLWFGSIFPLAIAGVGLFVTLSFMNGLI